MNIVFQTLLNLYAQKGGHNQGLSEEEKEGCVMDVEIIRRSLEKTFSFMNKFRSGINIMPTGKNGEVTVIFDDPLEREKEFGMMWCVTVDFPSGKCALSKGYDPEAPYPENQIMEVSEEVVKLILAILLGWELSEDRADSGP